ncbi:MAG: hypothetical protein ACHBN1_22415 [Heteroscytonema crispum UTEX LB 1556]
MHISKKPEIFHKNDNSFDVGGYPEHGDLTKIDFARSLLLLSADFFDSYNFYFVKTYIGVLMMFC